jgi:hypothetical protein
VLVGGVGDGWRGPGLGGADTGEAGHDDLVTEYDDARDGAGGIFGDVVAPRLAFAGDQVLGAQLRMSSAARRGVVGVAGDGVNLRGEAGSGEPGR